MNTYEEIKKLLIENNIEYEELIHEEVTTALEASLVRENISLSEGAKSLILKVKRKNAIEYINIIVCGNAKFDNKLIRKIVEASEISFASPKEVEEITHGVVPGGVPPFGNLFGIKVYADENILNNEKIAFSAGKRSITIVMKTNDWKNLVKPLFYKLY